ncbi:hypothetical protein [Eggerthella sinensis]|uniref:hypothetical protein n=1 Tax=Eggerthella sinensis TaxID=242230 RepID=UPI001D093D6B|nr:hypothetical protein [Eggerthella sinensis]MCB7038700.1 hypothetical protein [Eggerthella sinensis]
MDAFDIAQLMANQDSKRPLKLRYGTVFAIEAEDKILVIPDGALGTSVPAVKCCNPSTGDRVVLLTTETEWLAVAVIGGRQSALDVRGVSAMESLTLKSPLPIASGGTGAATAAATRANLSIPGTANANGYWGLTRPDGNAVDYLRAPSSGLIPYQSGGNGSLGTAGWPWLAVHANNIYRNGKSIGTLTTLWTGSATKGKTISLNAQQSEFNVFLVHFSTEDTPCLCTRYSTWVRGIGGHDNGAGSWITLLTLTVSGAKWTLVAASSHCLDTSASEAETVSAIYGVI